MKSIYRNLSIALVMGTSTLAAAQDMAPVPPAAPAAAPAAEKTMAFGANVFVGVPTDAEGVDGIVGVLGTIDYALQPQLEVTGRIGYMHYLVDGDGVSLSQIPLWGGARYFLAPGNQGLFFHGEAGINLLRASIDLGGATSSNSETEFGVNLLGGFRQGKLIAEGGLYITSLDNAGDLLIVGGTVGTTF